MTVASALDQRVLDALKNSEWWTPATRVSGTTIQGLTCPACGVRGAAWAYSENPMSLNCNRLSQCGARTRSLELFPQLRRNIEKDFPPTRNDPARPAREYLLSRGLPPAILENLQFWYLEVG